MFLSHLVGVFQQWRRYNNSLRELNRLGDRELADIGITRGDIPRVAWENSEQLIGSEFPTDSARPTAGAFVFCRASSDRARQAPSMPLDLSTPAADGPVSTLMKALAASASLAAVLSPTT